MLGRNAVASYDSQSNSSVAAMVAKLMRNTRFPEGMHVYIPAAEAAAEISRRIATVEAERFAPLFEVRWRDKFPSLSAVFHKPCGGSAAYDLASTLAAQLTLGQPLTKSVADAVEAVARRALPSLDTADLRSAGNQLRMDEVVRFTKEGKDKDKDKEAESSEQLA